MVVNNFFWVFFYYRHLHVSNASIERDSISIHMDGQMQSEEAHIMQLDQKSAERTNMYELQRDRASEKSRIDSRFSDYVKSPQNRHFMHSRSLVEIYIIICII